MTAPLPARRRLTVRAVAELLRQIKRQVWRDIAAGKLSLVRLGGLTRAAKARGGLR